jgi:hypothetical protein
MANVLQFPETIDNSNWTSFLKEEHIYHLQNHEVENWDQAKEFLESYYEDYLNDDAECWICPQILKHLGAIEL